MSFELAMEFYSISLLNIFVVEYLWNQIPRCWNREKRQTLKIWQKILWRIYYSEITLRDFSVIVSCKKKVALKNYYNQVQCFHHLFSWYRYSICIYCISTKQNHTWQNSIDQVYLPSISCTFITYRNASIKLHLE